MTTNRTKTDPLYFIAIVIDKKPGDEINGFKHLMAKHYASKAALRSPPHITLHMPFVKPEKKEEKMKEKLSEFCQSFDPFDIELKDFGSFDSRVIFVNVVVNETLLKLQNTLANFARSELGIFNAVYKGRPFQPHITMAFRDLSKVNFSKVWNHFQNLPFDGIHHCHSIALLKHNGKTWDINASFPFS
ncbi:MAG: 2'-5' RNA ligase family protein [Bacteroidetes bacterium]|nr:2'-5' RNA ligase family protein [Bacteroidota bacterium]MDA1119131.1 2'-5' RNA ligase family protein [Bacteroidota bacterium]